jgi:hypothetical protein
MSVRAFRVPYAGYYLSILDDAGVDRGEGHDALTSEEVHHAIKNASTPFTDVLFPTLSWIKDDKAAIEQYDCWFRAVTDLRADREAAEQAVPAFNPLMIDLQWPSLPWGAAGIPASVQGRLSEEVQACAATIVDTPKAQDAIPTILHPAYQTEVDNTLTSEAIAAYRELFAEAGLTCGMVATAQVPRDGEIRGPWSMPPRLLRERVRLIGSNAGRQIICSLQAILPEARFHLMGQGLGSTVVSAILADEQQDDARLGPVESLFLMQGAQSAWSYGKQWQNVLIN